MDVGVKPSLAPAVASRKSRGKPGYVTDGDQLRSDTRLDMCNDGTSGRIGSSPASWRQMIPFLDDLRLCLSIAATLDLAVVARPRMALSHPPPLLDSTPAMCESRDDGVI